LTREKWKFGRVYTGARQGGNRAFQHKGRKGGGGPGTSQTGPSELKIAMGQFKKRRRKGNKNKQVTGFTGQEIQIRGGIDTTP